MLYSFRADKEKEVFQMRPKNRAVYRFAIPLLTLVTAVAAILLWDYSVAHFGDMFRGYADAGRMGDVISAFISEPAVFLTAAALLSLNIAAVAAVVRAIRSKHAGAYFFLLLIVINIAVFIGILFIAVREVAA